jgi:small-conductance mechanosensitive channel
VTAAERLAESLVDYLPRLFGALALLVVGFIVIGLVVRVLRRVLTARDVDVMAERLGAHDVLGRAGLERSLVRAIVLGVRLFLSLVLLLSALAVLGPEPLQESLGVAVLFLPRLLLAIALVLVGVVLGALAKRALERWTFQMGLRGPLDEIGQISVIAVFTIMAASALGVPSDLLVAFTVILLGGMALTLALAFGGGSRGVAREVASGRYVAQGFHVGQDLSVAGVRGRIVAFEATSTVLEDADGRTIRVPNHVLLESVVAVEPPAGPKPGG